LPDSPEARALHESAVVYETRVNAWPQTHPDGEERETMMIGRHISDVPMPKLVKVIHRQLDRGLMVNVDGVDARQAMSARLASTATIDRLSRATGRVPRRDRIGATVIRSVTLLGAQIFHESTLNPAVAHRIAKINSVTGSKSCLLDGEDHAAVERIDDAGGYQADNALLSRLELLGSLIGAEFEVRDGLSDACTCVCAQPLMPVIQVVRNAGDRYAGSLRHVLYPHATGFAWSQILRRLRALRCHPVQHPAFGV
jgi:hypothetical protein